MLRLDVYSKHFMVFTHDSTRRTFVEQDLRNGRRGTTSEIAQVMLPSGDLIWVHVKAEQAATSDGGDVERFALRLANHPDEISAVTEIIREDQLTRRQDTIDFIKHMVDSGVVERWEVSDQVREALEWLREATARSY